MSSAGRSRVKAELVLDCRNRARRGRAVERARPAALVDRHSRQDALGLRPDGSVRAELSRAGPHLLLRAAQGRDVGRGLRRRLCLLRSEERAARRHRGVRAGPAADAAERRPHRPAGPLHRRRHGREGFRAGLFGLAARRRPEAHAALRLRALRQLHLLQPGRAHDVFRRFAGMRDRRLRLRSARPGRSAASARLRELPKGRGVPGRLMRRRRGLHLERGLGGLSGGSLRARRPPRPHDRGAGRQADLRRLRRTRSRHAVHHHVAARLERRTASSASRIPAGCLPSGRGSKDCSTRRSPGEVAAGCRQQREECK